MGDQCIFDIVPYVTRNVFLSVEVKKWEPDFYRNGIVKSVPSWDKDIIVLGKRVVK